MVSESFKKHEKIINLFIRGRKMAGMKGLSTFYLTQSYFKVPKPIRSQATKLFIRKINGKKDLSLVLSDCAANATMEQIKNMYDYCCDPEDITQFLLIDYNAFDEQRFRKGLDEILDISNF
jgi:hypothetical protein